MTAPVAPQLLTLERRRASAPSGLPLFELGFRPFFLLAAAFSALGVPLWLLALRGGIQPGGAFGSMQWHAHEMLFGFTAAVLAGFLLTATTNWTGRRTARGGLLGALAALWVSGRVAVFFAGYAPLAAAVIDVAFLPAVAGVCAVPIVASRNRRNYAFIAVSLALAVLNVASHAAALATAPGVVRSVHVVAVDLVVVVMALVTGRIVPSFTRNATGRPAEGERALERAALAAVVALALADAIGATVGAVATLEVTGGVLALLAAVLLALRMRHWGTRHVMGEPLLWVLHVGSAWLPLGLALRAGAVFFPAFPAGSALHALTAGAIGSLTIGMMARVSLGHTGRMLRASRADQITFVSVAVAGVVRVLAPWLPPAAYLGALDTAGVAWAFGFALFFATHVGMLSAARVDGR